MLFWLFVLFVYLLFAVPDYVLVFNFSQQSNNSKPVTLGSTGFVALKASPCLWLKWLSKVSLKTLSWADSTKELTGEGIPLLLLQGKHWPKIFMLKMCTYIHAIMMEGVFWHSKGLGVVWLMWQIKTYSISPRLSHLTFNKLADLI